VPSPAPALPADAVSRVASIYAVNLTGFVAASLYLVLVGLTPNDLINVIKGESPKENSSNNNNPILTNTTIYPNKSPEDALYTVSENSLRSAIYILQNFTYGKVPPVLPIPGIGGTAEQNFAANFGKLFTGSDYADPVFVNIPGNQHHQC